MSTMHQISIDVEVTAHDVMRERTLGGAIDLCAKAAGKEPKELQIVARSDKAQWSRWVNGAEGIVWCKLRAVMDECGNHAPVLWMLHDLGYDLHSLRKRESETERELRLAREENAALKRILMGRAA
ncbi:MAG: hypothetical protein L6Q68_03105 [Aquabacterium sp.]|nr:hypothetical protein [Aquabacterium sp.]